MANLTISPSPYLTVFDTNGDPVALAKIYTYTAGTATPVTTWQDQAGATPNANPIVADSAGRYVAFLQPGLSYKFEQQTAAGAAIKTVDNILATPASAVNTDVTGTVGVAVTPGQTVYLSDGSGGLNAGQWYLAATANAYSNSSPIVGMVPDAISISMAGTIRLLGRVTGLSGLTVGTSYYVSATPGALSATSTNARFLGVADSTTSLVMAPNPPSSSIDLLQIEALLG